MSAILTLQDISYRQSGFQLLSDINFSVSRGQIIGLIGVNGAGKSTTLKVAAGLLQPDSGQVIRKPSVTIGYVPEIPPLIPTWRVDQFLTHACMLHGILPAEHSKVISHVCDICDLHGVSNKTCAALSKGNQQRVNIAQALLHSPDILILDEPTSGLDPQQISQYRELLTHLKAHTAILFSSHIMQEITALCDRAIIIHQGKQVGELNLSERDSHLLIEFSAPVAANQLQRFPAWQSGSGRQHQFIFATPDEKNAVLNYCLANQLSIARIAGFEALAEREFLSLIGHVVNHA